MKILPIREQSINLLLDREKNQGYMQLLLKEGLKGYEVRDKAFATELIYGTLKYQMQIDYLMNQFSNTPVKKMKPFIRMVLRTGVYQLLYMDKVPDSAAINEAVKITKKRKFTSLSGFVNAILRNISRNKESLPYPDSKKNNKQYLSIKHSLPEWMIALWLKSYDEKTVEKIAEALNERPKVTIRINTLKTSSKALENRLIEEKKQVEKGAFLEEAFVLTHTDDIAKSPSFTEGEWIVQDESAMLVGHVVNPSKGDKILDMCSAPGGKTTHLAEIIENNGEIIACDIHPHKLELIKNNASRLGITCIQTMLQDGSEKREEWKEHFDKVLLDAPCSGLGIMKRKPDIRQNRKEEDIKELVAIQKKLLENAVYYTKNQGTITYSTCTICEEENTKIVRYATDVLHLEIVDIKNQIPTKLLQSLKENNTIEILPFQYDTDGFFIASFRKRG